MTLDFIGVRHASFPFDWLYRGEADNYFLEEVTSLLQNDFLDFFEKDALELQGDVEGHDTVKILNKKTKFAFIHDLHKGDSFEKQFSEIKKKYDRRIARLFESVRTARAVLFVYMDTQKTPDRIFESFIRTAEQLFPETDVELLVLQHCPNMGEFDTEEYRLGKVIKIKYNNSEKYATRTWDRWYRNEKVYKDLFFKYCLLSSDHTFSKEQPKVTVVLPTFNSEKFLRQTVNSILNQTFQNFELLVVDDASKDATRDILQSYNDSRIRIVDGPGNGLAAALNLGIREARGKYIARIDADDMALPTRFEKQVNFLDKHSDVSIVGTYQEHFGAYSWVHKPQADPDIIKSVLLFFCDICHSTLMLRKEDLLRHEFFYPDESLQEDYEFWTQIMGTLRFSTIPEVLALYRVHGGSITDEKEKKLVEYERSISKNALLKYFGIKIGDSDLDLLQRRHPRYNSMSIYQQQRYQLRLSQLFNEIEQKNKTSHFTPQKKLHAGLTICWNRIIGDTVTIKNLYAAKNNTSICLFGIPIFMKVKKENRSRYYIFGFHVYTKYYK